MLLSSAAMPYSALAKVHSPPGWITRIAWPGVPIG